MLDKKILILGAGKIGKFISNFLALKSDYKVYLADVILPEEKNEKIKTKVINASDKNEIVSFVKKEKIDAVISCLPFHCNANVAEAAKKADVHYFDLTEDVTVADYILKISKGSKKAFVPQCGLAPGFISIVANKLMSGFESIERVDMRVGALPQSSNNKLKYALTWSTEGLINEYSKPCKVIDNYILKESPPLNDLESINIDGILYEAFSTSGGLGSLPNSYDGKVKNMSYKTLRYPGHCQYMKFLLQDLQLKEKSKMLKEILESAIPYTEKDLVVIYVSVVGYNKNKLSQKLFVKKIYPKIIGDTLWSAIQVSTGTSVCNVLDLVLKNEKKYQGFIKQESFSLDEFLNNKFGTYFLD